MLQTVNNPQVDEPIGKTWIRKSETENKVRFAGRARVTGLVSLALAFSALLWKLAIQELRKALRSSSQSKSVKTAQPCMRWWEGHLVLSLLATAKDAGLVVALVLICVTTFVVSAMFLKLGFQTARSSLRN